MLLSSAVRSPIYYVTDYTKPAIIHFQYMPNLTCWFKSDKFEGWKKYSTLANGEPLKFYAFEDGVYSIKALNGEDAPEVGAMPDAQVFVDTRSPVVQIISPKPGEIYSGRTPIPVMWKITDGIKISRKASIDVGIVDDDGSILWKPITRVATPYPDAPLDYQTAKVGIQKLLFKVNILDDAGHFSFAMLKSPVFVDNVPPVTSMGHLEINKREIIFDYSYNDIGDSPLAEIKLLFRKLGEQTWNKLALDDNTYSPMKATLPADGRYELMTVATDYAGNIENKTDAEKSILIDTEAPKLKFTSFLESKEYIADQKVKITGQIDDLDLDVYSVSLYFSANNGISWQLINSEPLTMNDNKFSYDWVIPEVITTQAKFKIVASDLSNYSAEIQNPTPFVINLRENPEAMIVNVRTISGGIEFGYQVLGIGTREITEVQLWKGEYKNNQWTWVVEKTENILKTKDVFGTIEYQGATANLGFSVRCITKTGEKESELNATDGPEAFFKGFVPVPRAHLNTLATVALLKGGVGFSLGWKATTTNECKLNIDYSTNDGKSWQKISHDISIPKTGLSSQTLWNLPMGDHSRVMLRMSLIVDGFYGTSYTYCDVPLKIDGAAPVGRLLKPAEIKIIGRKAISNAPKITFPHNFTDVGLAGILELELWAAIDRAAPVLVKTFRATEKIQFNVPDDGVHVVSFRIIAKDNIGNTYRSESLNFEIDRKPASIVLNEFNVGGNFLSDSQEKLTWKADDTNLVEKPVEIFLRRATNLSWELVSGPLTNNSVFNWHLPRYLVTDNCEIKIITRDDAGNVGVAISAKPFAVSVHNEPIAKAIEPAASSGGLGHKINVKYGVSYSKKTKPLGVHMFVTNDFGKTYNHWRTVSNIDGNSEFIAPVTGKYGITFVAFDNRGFTEAIPQSGDVPELMIDVQLDNDVEPYSLRLMPDKQEYSTKDRILVRWFLRGNAPIEKSIIVELSGDAGISWKEVASNKLKGETTIKDTKVGVYFVRLTFMDMFGKKHELCREIIVK